MPTILSSFRLATMTVRRIEILSARTGLSKSAVVVVAVDRMYGTEIGTNIDIDRQYLVERIVELKCDRLTLSVFLRLWYSLPSETLDEMREWSKENFDQWATTEFIAHHWQA